MFRLWSCPQDPAHPSTRRDYYGGSDASHTAIALADTYEYILAAVPPAVSALGTAGANSATEVAATGGQHVYVRAKATASAFASDWADCGEVLLGVDNITLTDVVFAAGTVKVRQKDKTTNEHIVINIDAPTVSAAPALGSKTYNSDADRYDWL